MRASYPLLVTTVLLGACGKGGDDAPPQRPPPAPAVPPDAATAQGPSPGDAPAPDLAAATEAEARTLVDAWLDSQNTGAFDAYAALYHPSRMTGVKRTADGKAKTYDSAAWRADRKRMFAHPQTVVAEQVQVRTGLSGARPQLPPGVSEITFRQRWKSGTYADRGPKVMRLLHEQGRQWIVYEDMVQSAKGWEDPATDPGTGPCEEDPTLSPRRAVRDDAQAITRTICMVAAVEDATKRRAMWAEYLPPFGQVTLVRDVCPDDPELPPGGSSPLESNFDRNNATGDEIAALQFVDTDACTPGELRGTFRCSGVGAGVETAITLSPDVDGKLYVTYVEIDRLTGCGC